MDLVSIVEKLVGGKTSDPQVKGLGKAGREEKFIFDGLAMVGHVDEEVVASCKLRMQMQCRWRMWI